MMTMMMRTKILRAPPVWATLLVAALSACGDDPMRVELQVIEEVEFAPSLGIDLAAFTKLPSGVYIQDVVVGTGAAAEDGVVVEFSYARYFTHGQRTQTGSMGFTLGDHDSAIVGLHEGIRGMRAGGERRIIVPPELAYGEEGLVEGARVDVPAGWIVIFDVTLNGVS
jgi:FKBP-type peptidyl-prolyl cis-trans isomerase FkpA